MFALAKAGLKGKTISDEPKLFKPIVIVPGTGGSRLEGKLNKPSTNHWYCSKTSDWYTLWLSVPSLLPPAINCWVDNIKMLWDSKSK